MRISSLVSALLLTAVAEAAVTWDLASSLGDNMVLQRHPQTAKVWGGGINGTVVSLDFSGKTYNSTIKNSQWSITLDSMPAGSHGDLKFYGGGINRTLTNVLFGDVILCSGQSNMVFSTQQMYQNKTYIDMANQAKYRSIRLMTANPHVTSGTPMTNLTILQPWSEASSQTVADGDNAFTYFSAVCWLTGMRLFDDLQGEVPIGLLSSAVGGTQVKCWSSPDADKECCNAPPCSNSSKSGVSVCWNAHIAPILTMQFRSVLWLQGESDVNPSDTVIEQRRGGEYYSCAIQAMIKDWRAKLQHPSIPFIWVQLSPWTGHEAATSTWQLAAIRQAQTAANNITATGFASAVDLGDYDPDTNPWGNVHFRHKSPLGDRLADAMRTVVYNQQIAYKSPSMTLVERSHNGSFLVRFADYQKGLIEKYQPCPYANSSIMNPCSWWTLQSVSGELYNATGTIVSSDSVVVTAESPAVASVQIKSIAYLYSNWPVATIYNSAGLPALPFNYTF
eukprot:TRINITY_DN20718_c0_g1_i1.p1 TRINITY_DN20718_c0_g1~~TRINITY_DN20718_c0_g1_i1.p1  ORF type:complete len:505 (+),score=79.02 TRINITY_DN20718_c0_g1_i1:60-1574(+)